MVYSLTLLQWVPQTLSGYFGRLVVHHVHQHATQPQANLIDARPISLTLEPKNVMEILVSQDS